LAKIRIRDLAKELGVESKTLLDFIEKKGVSGKTPASGLEEDLEGDIRKNFGGSKKEAGASAEEAGTASSGDKKTGEKPEADKKASEQTNPGEKPKKKKLLVVMHRENASSGRERRGFRQGNSAQGRDRRNNGASGSARRGQNENGRRGRFGGNTAGSEKPDRPLVYKPRPHGVIRNENPKPPVSNVPERKPVVDHSEEIKKQQAIAEQEAAAKKAAEEAAAEAAAKAADEAAKKAAEEKAAESAPAAAAAPAAEKPAAQAQNPANAEETGKTVSAGTAAAENAQNIRRNSEVSHTDASRTEGRKEYQPRNDRNNGQGRSYGDRGHYNNGQGDRGQRSYGDRQNRNGQDRQGHGERSGQGRSYGDHNSRSGQGGQNRQGFGAGRRGNSQFNRDGSGSGRFGGHTGRPGAGRNDHRVAAPVMENGNKKNGRDSRGHDKDRAKGDLRGNKFTNDSRKGRHSNKQMIPKALKKPVHKKDEKKEEKVTEIKIGDKLTIRELAEKMKMNPSTIVADLFMKGEMYTINQEVDYDKAEEIAMNYDILCEHEEAVDVIAEMLKEDEEDESKMVPRPPVVCVMGHVDHGKTSLLDYIRHSHVTSREAGGITQNIGAYCVETKGRKITFLDTPGHEAFTAMRMRGANSTDIAVLVVAADDGVMPQTIEAINHAKAANVEIIVAINKIDKPGANPDRVKQELTEYGLVASDWGGQTEMVEVSAKTGQGIDDLLDTILLTADILELKANPDRLARGLVLEARLDKGKGPVANLLVQKGTLHIGDYIACGSASGKVRAMTDENGKLVRAAGPSTPVGVQGLNGVPDAGEILVATETDKEAKNIAAAYINEHKNKLLEETKSRMSLDALFDQIKDGSVKELELVVKADVQGSVEALKQALEKLSNDEVVIKIIHGGVGAINESDVSLAAASNAIVIGFNVRPDQTAKALAEEQKVDIRLYRVIYQAIDDITAAMNGMLEPVYEEKVIGHAEVRQIFKASGVGAIAGSYVLDGSIQRNSKVRVFRGDDQIFEGEMASLKRFKDDVKEVKAGYECGIVVNGFADFAEGDRIEAYIMAEVPR
jgi:translation initiation factor IF-2